MKSATKMTSKGQIVIPKPVREKLRWRAGTRLAIDLLPGGVVQLQPDGVDPIEAALGCLAGLPGDPIAELEADHRAELAADERWMRGEKKRDGRRRRRR